MTNPYEIRYNLIVESCRIEPDHNKIQNYIGDIDDWSSLLNISYAHGVLPLVYKALKKQKNIPQEALNMFKMQNMQIAQTNIQMTAELVKIVKLFDENDIRYMAIKGPVLSQLIHGNTVERQYADLDIVLEKEDIYKGGELLYANGYTSEHDLKFLKNKTLLKIGKDFAFKNKKNNIYVEVHWRLFLNRFIKKTSMKLFTPQAIRCKINNYHLQTLELEYLLVYLCLHGSQHFWERIEWVVDIDRLIKLNKNINWYAITKIIKDIKIESKVYLGLSVTKELFETEFPEHIKKEISKISKIKDRVLELQFMENLNINQRYRKHKIIYIKTLLTDSKISSVRNYLLLLFQIKDEDIYSINLPYLLSPLYYIIRQFKLFNIRIKAFKK